jgi:hypothetical protein
LLYELRAYRALLVESLECDSGRARTRIDRLSHKLRTHIALNANFGARTGPHVSLAVRLFALCFSNAVAKRDVCQLTTTCGCQTCIAVCNGHCSSLNGDFIVRQQIPNSAQLERTLRSVQPGRCLECVPDTRTEGEVLESTAQIALPGCTDSIPAVALVRPQDVPLPTPAWSQQSVPE